ncbi:uncharacterized protein LOC116295334 [Actinia tenebrosa]|uniref:Uncharacterized protein LOC116295334 n=1 Tax=Actinia tenebrosa TaxID=6105 RepID=A0A6P8HUA0_ACTTE|nr:uncharacterized protein LOC116295334 [Actinia tenebrosa]
MKNKGMEYPGQRNREKFEVEDVKYEKAAERLLFGSGIRTAIVLISLITILPIGIVALVFWIRGKKRLNKGEKAGAADDFAEAENMALTSISFGILGVITILMCLEQLKRNLRTVYG